MEYHHRAGVELPNEQGHAVIHAIAENQIALGGETPIKTTLERPMRESLPEPSVNEGRLWVATGSHSPLLPAA
jgi:hypothetical protein